MQAIQIGVIMFNDDIKKFASEFKRNITYLIENVMVKGVNTNFASVHPEKELVLNHFSNVKEILNNIEENHDKNVYVEYKDLRGKHEERVKIGMYFSISISFQ